MTKRAYKESDMYAKDQLVVSRTFLVKSEQVYFVKGEDAHARKYTREQ